MLLNSDKSGNLMYNESLFTDGGGTGAVCVVRAAEGVEVGESVQAKFIKVVII